MICHAIGKINRGRGAHSPESGVGFGAVMSIERVKNDRRSGMPFATEIGLMNGCRGKGNGVRLVIIRKRSIGFIPK